MKFLFINLFFLSFIASPSSVWETLCKAKGKIIVEKTSGQIIVKPILNKAIKKIKGEEIIIQGYKATKPIPDYGEIIVEKDAFILCRYQDKFFGCVSPGIVAYIEISCKITPTLKENQFYTFKGTFETFTKNTTKVPYQLKNAECLNCE